MINILNKRNAIVWIKKILVCLFGLLLIGVGAAFNIKACWGSDPITVFYEGLSLALSLDIGLAINIINCILIVLVYLMDRKYVNIGTAIYLAVLGPFVNLGVFIYEYCGFSENLYFRLFLSLIGCIFAFVGISLFIVAEIGIDPWTALAIIVSDKINKSFKIVKIVMDVLTLAIGIWMGGVFGFITVLCAVLGGPSIQKITEVLDNMLKNMIKFTCEDQVKE